MSEEPKTSSGEIQLLSLLCHSPDLGVRLQPYLAPKNPVLPMRSFGCGEDIAGGENAFIDKSVEDIS